MLDTNQSFCLCATLNSLALLVYSTACYNFNSWTGIDNDCAVTQKLLSLEFKIWLQGKDYYFWGPRCQHTVGMAEDSSHSTNQLNKSSLIATIDLCDQ